MPAEADRPASGRTMRAGWVVRNPGRAVGTAVPGAPILRPPGWCSVHRSPPPRPPCPADLRTWSLGWDRAPGSPHAAAHPPDRRRHRGPRPRRYRRDRRSAERSVAGRRPACDVRIPAAGACVGARPPRRRPRGPDRRRGAARSCRAWSRWPARSPASRSWRSPCPVTPGRGSPTSRSLPVCGWARRCAPVTSSGCWPPPGATAAGAAGCLHLGLRTPTGYRDPLALIERAPAVLKPG